MNVVYCDVCNNDYLILNDPKRSVNNDDRRSWCDHIYGDTYTCGEKSPDWKGSSWYRFMEPAGTRMPESVVESRHCGALMAGE